MFVDLVGRLNADHLVEGIEVAGDARRPGAGAHDAVDLGRNLNRAAEHVGHIPACVLDEDLGFDFGDLRQSAQGRKGKAAGKACGKKITTAEDSEHDERNKQKTACVKN